MPALIPEVLCPAGKERAVYVKNPHGPAVYTILIKADSMNESVWPQYRVWRIHQGHSGNESMIS